MLIKYYVVYMLNAHHFSKGVYACPPIAEDSLEESLTHLRDQIIAEDPHAAANPDRIGIISWQPL